MAASTTTTPGEPPSPGLACPPPWALGPATLHMMF